MMVNNAGDVFKLCISSKRKHKLYSRYARYISYQWYFKRLIVVFKKFLKNLTTRVPNYTQIDFPYSTITSACQGSLLACTRTVSIFRTLTNMHRYRNEINTVNQLQLNYSTNIHLLIPRFMKILCVITIKLNTLTDVPYQMMVGGAFVYVCENLWRRLR